MAAAGGDTIVPTNWGGLITITIIVAVVAAATYFGMEFQFGHQGGADKTEEPLSVQDVFSASAKREVAAADTARVLTRADLAASSSSTNTDEGSSSDTDSMADDGADSRADSSSAAAEDDWGSAASDDWDTTTDDWDDEVSEKMESQENNKSSAVQAVADAGKQAVAATQQAARKATAKVDSAVKSSKANLDASMRDAKGPSGPVRERPDAEALRDWWSDASGDLAIRFAGTLDRGDKVSDGVAVMFSEVVQPAQGDQYMRLSDEQGNAVSGNWKAARNPSMLILDGLKPGRYQLAIDPAIRSQNGSSLKKAASGPVFVY